MTSVVPLSFLLFRIARMISPKVNNDVKSSMGSVQLHEKFIQLNPSKVVREHLMFKTRRILGVSDPLEDPPIQVRSRRLGIIPLWFSDRWNRVHWAPQNTFGSVLRERSGHRRLILLLWELRTQCRNSPSAIRYSPVVWMNKSGFSDQPERAKRGRAFMSSRDDRCR